MSSSSIGLTVSATPLQSIGLMESVESAALLGAHWTTLVNAIEELSHAMLKITGYVMKLAPLAVLAAMAATVAVNGDFGL